MNNMQYTLKLLNQPANKFLNLWAADYKVGDRQGKWVFASRNPVPDLSKPPKPVAVVICATILGEDGVHRMLITREWRVPIGDYEWGFSAGLIDAGETPVNAAVRELEEETGLKVIKIKDVSPPIISSAGLSDESVVMVFVDAEGTPSKSKQEKGEDIDLFLMDFEEVCQLCDRVGKYENVTIAAKAWPILYMTRVWRGFP